MQAEIDFLKRTNIKVQFFDGLLVNYAKQMNASVLIRGVRNSVDFEYENNLAAINKKLAPEIETVLLTTRPELAIVSSSLVRELLHHKEDFSRFVPKPVFDYIQSVDGRNKENNDGS